MTISWQRVTVGLYPESRYTSGEQWALFHFGVLENHDFVQDKEVGLPSKKTPETERGAERLMEAIELYQSYQEDLKSSLAESRKSKKHIPPPPLPLLMTAFGKEIETAEEFMAQASWEIQSCPFLN